MIKKKFQGLFVAIKAMRIVKELVKIGLNEVYDSYYLNFASKYSLKSKFNSHKSVSDYLWYAPKKPQTLVSNLYIS